MDDRPVSVGVIGDVGHHSLLASPHKRDVRSTVVSLVRTFVTLGMACSARCADHHKKIDFDVRKYLIDRIPFLPPAKSATGAARHPGAS